MMILESCTYTVSDRLVIIIIKSGRHGYQTCCAEFFSQLSNGMTSKHTIYKEVNTLLFPTTERLNKVTSIGNFVLKALIKITDLFPV